MYPVLPKNLAEVKPNNPFVTVHLSKMPVEMRDFAVKCATEAAADGDLDIKEKAVWVKGMFNVKYGDTWNCITGASIGLSVGHQAECYIRLSVGDLSFILFKTH